MQEIMKEIIRGEDIGVLATTGDTEPHCSLMAYIVDSSCSFLYFVTHKNTRKYQNLLQNPQVCLMIDTRRARGVARGEIKALSVKGSIEFFAKSSETNEVLHRFVEKHHHLKQFAQDPEAVFFGLRIRTLQLLNGATEATYETLA